MGVATHGIWCNARTYPTRCQYCREPVFYFSCSCGCRVFFDDLGGSWPVHHCIEYGMAVYGKPAVEDILAYAMQRPGDNPSLPRISREYAEQLRQQSLRDKRQPRQIVRMDPPPNTTFSDVGRVVEVIPSVDIFKRTHTERDNPVSVALLGPLGKQPLSQVTLLVDDPGQEDFESYTCFVSRSLLDRSGIIREDIVHFTLGALDLPLLGRVWHCQRIDPPSLHYRGASL